VAANCRSVRSGTSRSDAQLDGDVVDPALGQPVYHRHRLKVRQRQIELPLQPDVDRIPQLDLEADQIVEDLPQVRHDRVTSIPAQCKAW
jgi:hypothetical protein